MKSICFYFQIHQPFRLRTYRFFDIGNDHYYYDDFMNDDIVSRIAQRSYLPANETIKEMINTTARSSRWHFLSPALLLSSLSNLCLSSSTR